MAFLGTPRAAELLRYTDPPGHPECMRAALTLCPHIALARHRRARADRPGAGIMPPGSHGDKPDGWTLGITRYLPVDVPAGARVHRVPTGPVPHRARLCVRPGRAANPPPGHPVTPPIPAAARLAAETFIDSSRPP